MTVKDKNILSELSQLVKDYRNDKGMSRDYLADIAGVSNVLLMNLEKGNLSSMNLDKVVSISKAIGLDTSLLFTPTHKPKIK